MFRRPTASFCLMRPLIWSLGCILDTIHLLNFWGELFTNKSFGILQWACFYLYNILESNCCDMELMNHVSLLLCAVLAPGRFWQSFQTTHSRLFPQRLRSKNMVSSTLVAAVWTSDVLSVEAEEAVPQLTAGSQVSVPSYRRFCAEEVTHLYIKLRPECGSSGICHSAADCWPTLGTFTIRYLFEPMVRAHVSLIRVSEILLAGQSR